MPDGKAELVSQDYELGNLKSQPASLMETATPLTSTRLEQAARRILAELGTDDGNSNRFAQVGSYRIMQQQNEVTIQGLSEAKEPNRVILQQGQLTDGTEDRDVENLERYARVIEAYRQAERAQAISGTIRCLWAGKAQPGEIRGNHYGIQQHGNALHLKRVNAAEVGTIAIIPLDSQQAAIGQELTEADRERFAQIQAQIDAQLATEYCDPSELGEANRGYER
jgi:hypothetical protein